MNEHEQFGDRALEAASLELRNSAAMHNAEARRESVARVTATALLDIASSLRVMAAEAGLAMVGSGTFVERVDSLDDAESVDDADFLVVGDVVRRANDVAVEPDLGTVVKVGVTEGATFADVDFVNAPGGSGRYFTTQLERVTVPHVVEDKLSEGAPIEDDFTTPASALDALLDIENKPSRKKGKK